MELLKTGKEILTPDEILSIIDDYERTTVAEFDNLWRYYKGKNSTILDRPTPDPNNPDNKTPIPYGRKIITTFTGYAYRPKYITYKPIKKITSEDEEILNYDVANNPDMIDPDMLRDKLEQAQAHMEYSQRVQDFWDALDTVFKENNEPVKTSRNGRNTGIFGVAYELLYIDGEVGKNLPIEAKVRFFPVDPREMILIYDYSSEPKKKMAIRFYRISPEEYKVEVYYNTRVMVYRRIRTTDTSNNIAGKDIKKWALEFESEYQNYFGEVPVVAYYMGDEMIGLIKPVIPLIDDYDILMSDSMNEFDRFAHAYLIMKKVGLTPANVKKSPETMNFALKWLKRFRVFENLPENAEISFLTKDIPYGFIQFMSTFLENQIHIQSHVPDFTGEKFSGASGIAIQRLLFDFENVCSSAEADFDIGLYDRIRLISKIFALLGIPVADPGDIMISHKRNVPLNLMEFAQTATAMKGAGFSRWLVADIMPDDIIPNVEEELHRQDMDAESIMPDVSNYQSAGVYDDGNGGYIDAYGNSVDANGNPVDNTGTQDEG